MPVITCTRTEPTAPPEHLLHSARSKIPDWDIREVQFPKQARRVACWREEQIETVKPIRTLWRHLKQLPGYSTLIASSPALATTFFKEKTVVFSAAVPSFRVTFT